MKNAFIIFIVIIAVFSSCSKSLMDIGYAEPRAYGGGAWPTTPPDVKSVGPYSRSWDVKPVRKPNKVLEAKELVKTRTKFLMKFYEKLLSKDVTKEIMYEKFGKNCKEETLQKIATKNANSDPLKGWSAFLFSKHSTINDIEVRYWRDNWFLVTNKKTTERKIIEVYQKHVEAEPQIKSAYHMLVPADFSLDFSEMNIQ